MDSPPASTLLRSLRGHGWVIAGFVSYLIFLVLHMGAYGGGSDSSGYLNNARLLAQGTTHMPQRLIPGLDDSKLDPYALVPLGFRPLKHHRMAPTYPIGLPAAIAATAMVTGWDGAPHVTMALSALLGLVLTAALARCVGLPWTWSWFAALIVGASPVYIFQSMQLMSDVPAMAAATLTIICAWRSRERAAWSLLAGLAMAAGVLTRPSNLVLIIPAALCLGFSVRRWAGFIAGGLPGAVLQCVYNWHAYGRPFESGYGGAGSLFTLGIIPVTLRAYAMWFPVLFTPVSLLGLALPWVKTREPLAWVLVTWIAAVLGFYVTYYHTHETWWYLRFLLPAFPACVVGGLWVAYAWWEARAQQWRQRGIGKRGLGVALVLIVIGQGVFWNFHFDASAIGRGEGKYREVIDWARAHLPAHATLAVMQCSGALVYYSDFTFVRWDGLSPEQAELVTRASLAANKPLYAVLWPFEVSDIKGHMPGPWNQIATVRGVAIWQWVAPPP